MNKLILIAATALISTGVFADSTPAIQSQAMLNLADSNSTGFFHDANTEYTSAGPAANDSPSVYGLISMGLILGFVGFRLKNSAQ